MDSKVLDRLKNQTDLLSTLLFVCPKDGFKSGTLLC